MVLSRDRAPTLFRLIDDVTEATGAPHPDQVGLSARFNASAGAYGLRRRRVLDLGLPLWSALPPQQRVALLGHELGHFVNGDVRRGPLAGLTLTTLGRLAWLLRPHRGSPPVGGLAGLIGDLIAKAVLSTLSAIVRCGHVLLVWVVLRDAQRAEYLADELAARAGGSVAAAELLDTMLIAEVIEVLVTPLARRGHNPAAWHTAATEGVPAGPATPGGRPERTGPRVLTGLGRAGPAQPANGSNPMTVTLMSEPLGAV